MLYMIVCLKKYQITLKVYTVYDWDPDCNIFILKKKITTEENLLFSSKESSIRHIKNSNLPLYSFDNLWGALSIVDVLNIT